MKYIVKCNKLCEKNISKIFDNLVTFNTTDNASVDMRNVNASDGDMTVNEHLYKQGIRKTYHD